MLLTSHLDNLHNITRLKNAHRRSFPFFCSRSLWDFCSLVGAGRAVAPPGVYVTQSVGTEHWEVQISLPIPNFDSYHGHAISVFRSNVPSAE